MPKMSVSHRERLLSFVKRADSGCMEWLRKIDRWGYGHFKMDGKDWLAHRAAYWLLREEFDLSLTLDHLCRNPKCVNPAHLEPVTNVENLKRMPKPTHCKRGHMFTPTTVYLWRGSRHCLECRKVRAIEKCLRAV